MGCPADSCPEAGPVPPALLRCTPFTRPPEHPPGPSLLAGPVAPAVGPAASHWPSGLGMALGHWHWHWHWLASMLLAPHKQVGKWRAPLPSAICPLCLLVWGPAVEHPRTAAAAAPALLHAQAHPHSHSLLLSHSVGRSGLSFFLCLSPPLFTLFLPPPNLPYTSSTIHTLSTRDRPLLSPESA